MLKLQPKNNLEEALSKLDLQATLVLLNILSSQALSLQQAEAKKARISKLIEPETAIRLPD